MRFAIEHPRHDDFPEHCVLWLTTSSRQLIAWLPPDLWQYPKKSFVSFCDNNSPWITWCNRKPGSRQHVTRLMFCWDGILTPMCGFCIQTLQVKAVACPEFLSMQLLITAPEVTCQLVLLPTPLSARTERPARASSALWGRCRLLWSMNSML